MFTRLYALTVAAVLSVGVVPTNVARAQDPKGRVAEILADMISRRDQLKTYAVVLFGTTGPVQGERQPYAIVRVVDEAKQFDLQTHYRYTTQYLEYGPERVAIGDRYKWRRHPITSYYLEVPKTKENKVHRSFDIPTAHAPFDDWISVMGVTAHMNMTIEQHLERHPLHDAMMVDGKLVAQFGNPQDTVVRITTFDPAIESMPTRGEIRSRADGKLHHSIDLSWKKINGTLLLDSLVYEYARSSRNGAATTPYSRRFKIHWALDDHIPPQVFTGPDHLLPLLDHFRLPHSRYDLERDMWIPADLWTPLALPVPDSFQEFK